jgi:hypothetical protein
MKQLTALFNIMMLRACAGERMMCLGTMMTVVFLAFYHLFNPYVDDTMPALMSVFLTRTLADASMLIMITGSAHQLMTRCPLRWLNLGWYFVSAVITVTHIHFIPRDIIQAITFAYEPNDAGTELFFGLLIAWYVMGIAVSLRPKSYFK